MTTSLFVLVACSSKPKAVNEDWNPRVLPMPAVEASNQIAQDSIGRSPTAALSGKVLLQGDFPAPLSNIQVGLYKHDASKNRWQEVTKFSTTPDGSFSVTQKLVSGVYEVRVLSPKYAGTLKVTVDKEPLRDLVVMAQIAGASSR